MDTNVETKTRAYKGRAREAEAKVKSYEEAIGSIEDIKKQIESYKTDIESLQNYLAEGGEDGCSLEFDLRNSYDSIKTVASNIRNLKLEFFGGVINDDFVISKEDANELPESEVYEKEGIYYQKRTKQIEGLQQKVKAYETEIGELKKSITTSMENQLKEQRNKFDELKEIIESFLPTATAAGLSKAFIEAKQEHKKSETMWRYFFLAAIIAIFLVAGGYLYYFQDILKATLTISDIIKHMLRLIAVEFPFVWLGWTASKRIKQEARLNEEYLHKWAVAYSYEGLRKEAAELDLESEESSPQTAKLFSTFVNAYAQNPSNIIVTNDGNYPAEKLIKKSVDEAFKKIASKKQLLSDEDKTKHIQSNSSSFLSS